jgi:uncharacterized protein with FMN-binding domain
MRRAPIVLTATVAGLAAVLSFKPHDPALSSASASASAPAAPAAPGAGSGAKAGSGSGSGSTTGSTAGTKTATGDAIGTRYGNAQVRVTVSGGKITRVEALQLQGNDPKSIMISTTAEPLLRESALAKQSAAIDAVSGATITSASYEASLQSALDRLGFQAANGSRGSSTVPQVEERHRGRPGEGPPGEAFPG